MRHVTIPENPGPGGKFEKDPVGVLEVDGPHKHSRMHGVADAELAVVVIDDLTALDPSGHKASLVLVDPLRRDGERHVVHRAYGTREITLIGAGGGCRYAGDPL